MSEIIEKERIYKTLDKILNNLEELKNVNNKKKLKYLLGIQTLQIKLLYNALKDIDDMNDSILKIIELLKVLKTTEKKDIFDEDLKFEELFSDKKELKKTKTKIERKVYDGEGFYS